MNVNGENDFDRSGNSAEYGRKAAGRNMVSACFLCYSIDRNQTGDLVPFGGGKCYETKRKSDGTCYGIGYGDINSGRLRRSGKDGQYSSSGGCRREYSGSHGR